MGVDSGTALSAQKMGWAKALMYKIGLFLRCGLRDPAAWIGAGSGLQVRFHEAALLTGVSVNLPLLARQKGAAGPALVIAH